MDYSKFITPTSASRKHSAIRKLQKFVDIPGMISLGSGMPNSETFPFESITVKLKTGEIFDIPQDDISRALQYGLTSGDPKLIQWIKELQVQVHKPLYDYDVCIGNGSQDLMTKAMEAFLRPNDTILIESPTYPGILAFLRPLGVKFSEIPIDEHGLDPLALEQCLKKWPDISTRPKVFII